MSIRMRNHALGIHYEAILNINRILRNLIFHTMKQDI